MIERLIDFSIRNRAVVVFGVLLMGAFGLRAAQQLPMDAVPDVTNVQVQVLTTAPALGPLEVEKFITFPIETVMSGLPHLAEVRSLSKFGLSSVTIVFDEGTDIYFARQLVAERLAESSGPITAVSDFMAIVPDQIRQFVDGRTFTTLGTDGMGRSDTREALRRFFEIDTGHVVVAVLSGLFADGAIDASVVEDALARYDIDTDAVDPWTSYTV